MKYAVEVARLGSLNKAAETLLIAQPNISRSIKELEADLGITIFNRSARGMELTPEGEEFIGYAQNILKQIDEVEHHYRHGSPKKQKFSISVPRACYISDAFAKFSQCISDDPAEIFYKETNSMRAINNILRGEYNLAIIRYQETFEKYFESMFKEKNLVSRTITEFSYVLAMSVNNPLAKKEVITPEDLSDYIEIAHADPYVPSLPIIDVKKAEMSEFVDKRIYVFERASQYMLLEQVPNTFMWVSPMPDEMLANNNLVERECGHMKKKYKDVLIYRENYKLTDIDKKFISLVLKAKEGM